MLKELAGLLLIDKIQIGVLCAATIGLFLTWLQLSQSVKSQKVSLLHDMLKELRDLHLKLFCFIKDMTKENKETCGKEREVLVAEYLNYLEHLSVLVNEKYIDERLAIKIFRKLVVEDTPTNFKKEIEEGIHVQYIKLLSKWRDTKAKKTSEFKKWGASIFSKLTFRKISGKPAP